MPEKKGEYVVGVDFGGTKIYAGVFNSSLECQGTARVSTKADRGVEPVIERIARCVRDAVDECDLTLVSVAGPAISHSWPTDRTIASARSRRGSMAAMRRRPRLVPEPRWSSADLPDEVAYVFADRPSQASTSSGAFVRPSPDSIPRRWSAPR